jgi:hypothetical protein
MSETTMPQPGEEIVKPKRRSSFRKNFRWFLFIIFILIGAFCYWKYFFTYSDGLQGGKMQKISKKGNIFKTWEGYLLISASSDPGTGLITPKEWPFTVVDDSIAHVLENYAEKNVKLRYHQKNGTLPWRGDTRYIIYEVSLVQ